MDEKPDQIMNHIESQRSELGRNLNELENRVRRTADWRAQFDRNPMLMMGVALGGGLLLGTIVGGGRRSSSSSWSSSGRNYGSSSYGSSNYGSSSSSYASPSYGSAAGYGVASNLSSASSTSPAMREQRRKASDTLEHIKGALIGFATAKVKEFMTEALPGFNQHLDEAERRHNELNESSNQQSSSGGQQNYSGTGQQSYSGSGQQNFSSGQQNTGQQNTGYQGGSGAGSNPGGTRTEQSSQSPYRQHENVRS